jgi:holo-[acyl-carrier protein] synthase
VIFGIGIDILQADRVGQIYGQYGQRFVRRLLMPEEMDLFQTQKRPERFLAMRFAAKEAVVKAMGTGFANGMWIRDVGAIHNRYGRPEIIFSARGRRKCDALGIAPGGHLSLTDEAGLVVAVAVLMQAE